jgi:hypothetical protein
MILNLGANETKIQTLQGSRFYYEKGEHPINVRMIGGGDARDFDLYAGQGFVCEGRDDRFYALEITNKGGAQTIDFEVGDREKFDNRATIASTGDALPVTVTGGSGLIQIVTNGGTIRGAGVVAIPANTATLLRPQNTDRIKIAFNFPANVFLGINNTVTAANGFPMSAGSIWVDENTAAIWIFSTTAINVPFIEDIK